LYSILPLKADSAQISLKSSDEKSKLVVHSKKCNESTNQIIKLQNWWHWYYP